MEEVVAFGYRGIDSDGGILDPHVGTVDGAGLSCISALDFCGSECLEDI